MTEFDKFFEDLDAGRVIPADPPASPFEGFLREQQARETEELMASVRWAQQHDPDAWAKAARLAPSGVAPQLALRHMTEVERNARFENYAEVLRKAPAFRDHFRRQPEDLAYANPDELDDLNGLSWLFGAVSAGFETGQAQVEVGREGTRIVRDLLTGRELAPEVIQQFVVFSEESLPDRSYGVRDPGLPGFIQGMPVETAKMLPQIGNTLVQGGVGFLAGTALGGLVGAIGGVPGAVAGARTGGMIGGRAGAYKASAETITGLSFAEYLTFKDEEGNLLDPQVAAVAAAFSGGAGGLLEVVGLQKTIGQVPGLGAILGVAGRDNMRRMLRNAGFRDVLKRFAEGMATGTFAEVFTEYTQELIQITAGELAKDYQGGFANITDEEVNERLLGAVTQTLQGVLLLSAGASGARSVADVRAIQQARREHEAFTEFTDRARENPIVQRAPEVALRLIDAQHPDRSIYVPAETLVTYFQEAGVDPYGPPLPNWRQRLDEALALGGDVRMTLGEFVTTLGQDPKADPLRNLVRYSAAGYSQAEIAEYEATLDSMLLGEAAQAVQPDLGNFSEYLRGFQSQIEEAGYSRADARAMAAVLAAGYNTLGREAGLSVQEMGQEFFTRIVAGGQADPNALMQSVLNDPSYASQFQKMVALLDEMQTQRGVERAIAEQVTPEVIGYHGTGDIIERFDAGQTRLDRGVFFSNKPELANQFALGNLGGDPMVLAEDIPYSTAWEEFAFPLMSQSEQAAVKPKLARYRELAETLREMTDYESAEFIKANDELLALDQELNNLARLFTAYVDFESDAVNARKSPNVTPARLNLGKTYRVDMGGRFDWDKEREAVDYARANGYDSLTIVNWSDDPDAVIYSIFDTTGRIKSVWSDTFLQGGMKGPRGQIQFMDRTLNDVQSMAHQFTGTLRLLHGRSEVDDPFRAFSPSFDGVRYENGAGTFGGNGVYLDNTGAWNTGKLSRFTVAQSFDVEADFEKALVISPETLPSFFEEFGADYEGAAEIAKAEAKFFASAMTEKDMEEYQAVVKRYLVDGKTLAERARERGYDAIIVQGFGVGDTEEETLLTAAGYAAEIAQDQVFAFYPERLKVLGQRDNPEEFSAAFVRTAPQRKQYAIITLFESADRSTLLHESAHLFFQMMADLASRSDTIREQYERTVIALGGTPDGPLTREMQEAFARQFEAYLLEGKAPNRTLRSAFRRFKKWLQSIYRSAKNFGVTVSPEVRETFEWLLTVEERVNDEAARPIFRTAAEMGVDPEAYLEYTRLVDELREEAQETTASRVLGQQRRLMRGWLGEIQKELRVEFERKLAQKQAYRARAELAAGAWKIDPKDFRERYSEAAMKAIPRKAFSASEGLPVDVVANFLKYHTADEFVYDQLQAQPIKQAAKMAAQEEMVRRYGEDFSNSEYLDIAIKRAMATEGRTTVLAKEVAALGRKAGRNDTETSAKALAVEMAKRSLYGKRVKDLREAEIKAAVRRFRREGDRAILRGDWKAAALAKRRELVAHARDVELTRMLGTIERIRRKAARYSRKASLTVSPDYMEQIRALVERFEFTRKPLRKLARRESLRRFVETQLVQGELLNIPDYLLDDARQVNYRELTVEQLLDLGATLDSLEHIGRRKKKLRDRRRFLDRETTISEIVKTITQLPERKDRRTTYGEDARKTLRYKFENLWAGGYKPEQLVEWLDAGDIAGPMTQHVFEPIAEASALEQDLTLEYNKKLIDIFDGIDPKRLQETVSVPFLPKPLTRGEVFAIALNWGNRSNRDKLMEGERVRKNGVRRPWTEAEVEAILNHMTAEDWNKVQQIWDLMESLWPKIEAMYKRLTGVAPPRIEPMEFTNQHGTFRGGYYPVVYDFDASESRPSDDSVTSRQDGIVFDNSYLFGAVGTNNKYTVQRQRVYYPIKLDLEIIPQHVHKVIHDLAFREPVKDAYAILWDQRVYNAISSRLGQPVADQLRHWLRGVASQRPPEHGARGLENTIKRLRTNMTLYGMGYRVTTILSQPLGWFTSMAKIGPRWLADGIYAVVTNPRESRAFMFAKSGEMRHRFNNMERDIADTVRTLVNGRSWQDVVKLHAFTLIAYADMLTSSTTWHGAYRKGLAEGMTDELAVTYADRTVRLSQGTGSIKDMAQWQNPNSEVLKLITMFYSFFSAQHNMQIDLYRKTKGDILGGNLRALPVRLAQWMALVVIPATLGAFIVGHGPDEDEDESVAEWAIRKSLLYPLAAVPLVRSVAGALDTGFSFEFTPVERLGTEVVSAAKLIGRVAEGEDEIDPREATKMALDIYGLSTGLPTGQFANSLNGLWGGLEEGDFEVQDAFFGRRNKDQ